MNINVVAVKSGWILTKIAQRIAENAPDGVNMTLTSRAFPGENNFYVDVTNCFSEHSGGKDIGLFTHVHANNSQEIRFSWFELDHIIHMSALSLNIFKIYERRHKLSTTHSCMMPGEVPEGFEYKKPVIGIFQRGQYEGKGFDFMKDISKMKVSSEFNWIFVGNGWGEVIESLNKKTVAIEYKDSLEWPGGYKRVYDIVDYVMVPSKWEGGPMGLLEAASLGKQIIAPDGVGWCGREVPIDHLFIGGNRKSVSEILYGLVETRIKARAIVESLSYKKYAAYVVKCFEEIK